MRMQSCPLCEREAGMHGALPWNMFRVRQELMIRRLTGSLGFQEGVYQFLQRSFWKNLLGCGPREKTSPGELAHIQVSTLDTSSNLKKGLS